MIGWQVFSTNMMYGKAIAEKTLSSWCGFYDEMFVWLNGNGWNTRFYDNYATGILRTKGSHLTNPGGAKLRQTPLEIGYNLAKNAQIGLEMPGYIMQLDVDEKIPPHPDFKAYFKKWLDSSSRIMAGNWVYPWGADNVIRVDLFASQSWHGMFFKADKGFSWLPYKKAGFPKGYAAADISYCPYPFPHYNHFSENIRTKYAINEKTGNIKDLADSVRPPHYQVNPKRAVFMRYSPNLLFSEVAQVQKRISSGDIPEKCWVFP
jgi:hypothetical protein